MLTIGFDAKRAFSNYTGLGNYSRSVITSLAQNFPEHKYILYTTKEKIDGRTAILKQLPNTMVVTPKFPFFKSAWRSRFVVPTLQQHKLDIYHGLSHEIPLGIQHTNIKTVVTIHDLIFLRYPQYYKSIDRKIYEAKFRNACTNADVVVAISEQTKRDIIAYFDITAEKIKVVYQSCDDIFKLSDDDVQRQAVKVKYNLPEEYLLTVGTIEERKNLLLLAKALKNTPNHVQLVVVGKQTAYAEKVKQYLAAEQLTARVHFLENVSFTDLPYIYQLAKVFVYPSRFEGFGIPILEALYCGTPVIAAAGSCLEEAGGPDSMYVHPDDELRLSEQINLILNNSDVANDMVARGKIYAASFNEARQAQQLMDIYLELVRV